MKKLMAIVVTLVLTLSAVGALADTLTMATNASFPPYEFYDGEKVVGIDAEIAAAICAKLGYELAISDMEFDSIIPAVQSGKADFAMAGLTVTDERKQMINFSNSYATGIQAVVVAEGSPITCADDLFKEGASTKVGVQLATTGDIYTTGDIEDKNLGKVTRFPNGNEAVMALVNGKIDCVVIDKEPAKAYVAANKGLKVLDTEYATEDYAACIAKGNEEFLTKFNTALDELIADGTIKSIVEKYIKAE
ncbi:MAG: transporter substrate-binding domain-containing protein [Clostridia bacterium]